MTDTAPARDDAFTTLLGVELSSDDWDAEDVFWVNAIGVPADFAAPAPGEPHADAIRRAAEVGAFNVLLHPGLTNLLDFDGLPIEHLHAVETFNQNAALTWPDQAEGRYALDALLARGHRLQVAVGDDAHWHHPWDRFGAWVQVRAERPDPGLLLRRSRRAPTTPRRDRASTRSASKRGWCTSRAVRPGRSRSPASTGGAPTWRSAIRRGGRRRSSSPPAVAVLAPHGDAARMGSARGRTRSGPEAGRHIGYPPCSVRIGLRGRESPRSHLG